MLMFRDILAAVRASAASGDETIDLILDAFAQADAGRRHEIALAYRDFLLGATSAAIDLTADDIDLLHLSDPLFDPLTPRELEEFLSLASTVFTSLPNSEIERELRYALAQVLIAAHYSTDNDFWLSLPKTQGIEFLPLSLAAISDQPWPAFAEVLTSMYPEPQAAEAAVGLVPTVEATRGQEHAAALALLLWQQLQPDDRILLGSLLTSPANEHQVHDESAALATLLTASGAGPVARRGLAAAWEIFEQIQRMPQPPHERLCQSAAALSEPLLGLLCEEGITRGPADIAALALLRSAVVAAFSNPLAAGAAPDAKTIAWFSEGLAEPERLEVLHWAVNEGLLTPDKAASLFHNSGTQSFYSRTVAEPPWNFRQELQHSFFGATVRETIQQISTQVIDLLLPRNHAGVLDGWLATP